MNLVGKIFVVLIIVMSLVFMTFAVLVYSTHKNWEQVVNLPREKASAGMPAGLKFQLEDAKKENADLLAQVTDLNKQIEAAQQARQEEVGKLSQEVADLAQFREELERNYDLESKRADDAIATNNVLQQNEATLRTEVTTLRDTVRTAQQDRDDFFAQVVQLTDELNQGKGELSRLKSRNESLIAELTTYDLALQDHNINPYSTDDPPRVNGEIIASNGRDLVEVNLGTDDGLKVGHRLDVYRENKYLGRIEIIRAATDNSAAKIIPEYRKGFIQKEDRVASRLN